MRMILLLALLPLPAFADAPEGGKTGGNAGGKTIDCYCTDRVGARVELGQTICLDVDGRRFMAQCQMSLNSPMWREVQQGCLSSALPQSVQPAVDTGAVDARI